jgi:hypothetical protein
MISRGGADPCAPVTYAGTQGIAVDAALSRVG